MRAPISNPQIPTAGPLRAWFVLAIALGVAIPAARAESGESAGSARRDQALILTLDAYSDLATDERSRAVGTVSNVDEEMEVERGIAYALSLTYMRRMSPDVQAGGTFRYLSTYRFVPVDEEDRRDDDEDDQLGDMMELTGRLEYAIGLTNELDVLIGAEMGLAIVLPGGELSDELDTLGDQGYNIWGGPRLGVIAGPELTLRYGLSEWLYARVGIGLLYASLFLYDASTEDDNSDAYRAFALRRIRGGFGLEARF